MWAPFCEVYAPMNEEDNKEHFKKRNELSKKQLIELIADLLFAYKNKDEEFPHDFEIKSVNKAVEILKANYKDTIYKQEFFDCCKLEE